MKILADSFENIKRNRFNTLATVISISLILIIFNIIVSVNQITRESIQELTDKVSLNVFLSNEASTEDIENITTFLSKLPETESVSFVSAGEALQQIEDKYPGSVKFLEEFGISNPLPSNIKIKTKDLFQHELIMSRLYNSSFGKFIVRQESGADQTDTIRTVRNNLIRVRRAGFSILLWVIITFIVAGGLIIFNALRTTLYQRRSEIQIMQFVGATYKKILFPFLLEGAFIGFLGFALSLIVLSILSKFFPFIEGLNFFLNPDFLKIIALEGVIAVSIGILTSIYAVNRHINSKEIYDASF